MEPQREARWVILLSIVLRVRASLACPQGQAHRRGSARWTAIRGRVPPGGWGEGAPGGGTARRAAPGLCA